MPCPTARVNAWARVEDVTIDPCTKQNVTIFVYNGTKEPCMIDRGEVLAEVIVLQGFVPILDIRYRDGSHCTIV